MRYIFTLLALCSSVMAGDMDIRHLYTTNDVSEAVVSGAPIRWANGESVKWDIYARRGTNVVDLTAAGLTAKLYAVTGTNAVLTKAGTIAAGGKITFDMTPTEAAIGVGTYDLYVTIFDSTNRIGQIIRQTLQVVAGPSF